MPAFGGMLCIRLRCDLGVCRDEDNHYRLGVLIDTVGQQEAASVVERYLQHPDLMRRAGWQLERVTCRDWVKKQRGLIMQELNRALLQDRS